MGKKNKGYKDLRRELGRVRRAQKEANPPRYFPPPRRGKKSKIADLAKIAGTLPESKIEKENDENKFVYPEHRRKNLHHLLKGKQ